MATVTIGPGGELTLPADVVQRKGFKPDCPLQVVETRSGVLLVPLDDRPMSQELRSEIEAWQELSLDSWDASLYEETEE